MYWSRHHCEEHSPFHGRRGWLLRVVWPCGAGVTFGRRSSCVSALISVCPRGSNMHNQFAPDHSLPRSRQISLCRPHNFAVTKKEKKKHLGIAILTQRSGGWVLLLNWLCNLFLWIFYSGTWHRIIWGRDGKRWNMRLKTSEIERLDIIITNYWPLIKKIIIGHTMFR